VYGSTVTRFQLATRCPRIVSQVTDEAGRIADPDGVPDARRRTMGLEELDAAFEEFGAAQAGAVSHLETMSQSARDAAEVVLMASEPTTDEARSHAARLSQVAEQCDALGLLISVLDLPPAEVTGA
jgi:hypothetical protein